MAELVRFAPAKLNLTLEVTGKRRDGYHSLRSVVATVSLCDVLTVGEGRGFVVSADESYDPAGMPSGQDEHNTVELALALLVAERARLAGERLLPSEESLRAGIDQVAVRLEKRIPAAAGLGGGSSDAAATLRALADFWRLTLDDPAVERLALTIGSDCPFFVRGGAQLMSGRGEVLEPLPPPRPFWCCIVVPPVSRKRKTAFLYSLLREGDFSAGDRSTVLADRLKSSESVLIGADDLCNTFDNIADEAFGDLTRFRRALSDVGASAVHLCGSGPALYGLHEDERAAREAAHALTDDGYAAWAVSAGAESQAERLV